MLPSSQLILLVILIVLAVVLLTWEVNKTTAPNDEASDELSRFEISPSQRDRGEVSS